MPKPSLNARMGSLFLVVGGLSLALFTQIEASLLPLRLLGLGILAFGLWAFWGEMGHNKPLVRAGAVAALAALGTRWIGLLTGTTPQVLSTTAFAMLLAILIWSIAFLHRDRVIRRWGGLGVAAGLLPLAVLILGHVLIGAGVIVAGRAITTTGIGTPAILNGVDVLFGIWCLLPAALLWTGHIKGHD